MIEIVFNDSACESLKKAQYYEKGNYIGGCIGDIISTGNGSRPTQEEIFDTKKAAGEQEHMEWKNVVPMGGRPKDVFGFNLMLSVGDISADDFIGGRKKAIETLWSIYPNDPSDEPFNIKDELYHEIEALHKRLTQDDEVRIWYSNQPEDMCGLYWFMWELEQLLEKPKAVYIVKLPEYEYRENNTVVTHTSWGEVSPEEWYRYTSCAEITDEVFCKQCASKWKTLQLENSPLRAVINGQLHSVPESIYDEFIYREITNQEDEFQEEVVIGTVLGKYQLGIGDVWVANRIERMIANGYVSIVSDSIEGMPFYHRKLRKSN